MPVRIAAVVPLSGPAGIFGPSCEAVTELAVERLNAAGGVLGRPVEAITVDGGEPAEKVAARVEQLILDGEVEAVTGWHISRVRQVLAPRTSPHIPYMYTSLYEGDETTDGVFCSGEVPGDQIMPALRWLKAEAGTQRVFIVGSDYVWPRRTSMKTHRYCAQLGLDLVGEAYLPYGTQEYGRVVGSVDTSGADTVIMLFVGQDAVAFNRAFTARGLDPRILRFTPLMEENMLLGSGPEATGNLYVAAGYFASLATPDALDLLTSYVHRYGPDAPPLNNAAESCFEGLMALDALSRRAGSLEPSALRRVADGVCYQGARGEMHMEGTQVRQSVHLAAADGMDFDVITTL